MNQKSPQNQPQTIYDPQLVLAQFKRFLKTKKLSPLSIKNYLSDLRRFLAYLQNHQPHLKSLHSIKLHHFKSYLTHLTNQGFSPASLNRNIATLRQFGHFLEQVHNIENPTQNLARLGPTSPNSSSTNYIKHFTNYLKQQQLSSQTIKSYKSDINQYLHWLNTTYSSTQLKRLITKSNQQKYLNYLQKTQNHKPSTILRKSKSISRFTNWFTTIYSLFTPSDNKVTGTVPNRNTRGATSSRTPVQRGGTVPDVHDERRTENQYFKFWRTYLLLAFIALFFTALGVFGYRQFKKDVILSQAYPSSPVTPNRQLSFQGRLVDSSGTPITTATNFQFKLYDAETNGTQLYDTGTCSITPDQDGVFSVQIGKDCGSAIPSSVFTENSDVWLEVTVGSETLSPRQQIATVAYALNAETIQGIPLAATMAAIRNTIVPMNQWGEVILGEQSPTLKGVAGTLQIQAPSLTFSTATGTNGNIIFAPDGTGLVKILSNTQTTNSFTVQNAQLTSGSLIKGYVGNDTATGNLLTLSSGSTETNQFTVDTSGNTYIAGNVGIGTTSPGAKLDVRGYAKIFGGNTVSLIIGSDYDNNATITDSVTKGARLGAPHYNTSEEPVTLIFGNINGIQNNVNIGGGSSLMNAATAIKFYTATNTTTVTGTERMRIDANGNVGIGTTTPSMKLDVAGSATISGTLSLAPTLQVDAGTCDASSEGKQYYDADNDEYYYCDGNSWKPIAQGSSSVGGSGTTNYLSKWTGSSTLGNSVIYDDGTNVGIGTTSPTRTLDVRDSFNDSEITANKSTLYVEGNFNPTTSESTYGAAAYSLLSVNTPSGITLTSNDHHLSTIRPVVRKFGAGDVNELISIGGAWHWFNEGNVGNFYQIYLPRLSQNGGTGTIGTAYGLYITGQKQSFVTNAYGIYQAGTSDTNYFAGNVGIGTTSPSYKLDINDGDIRISNDYEAQIRFYETINNYTSRIRTDYHGNFIIYHNSENIPRFIINSSGNVGIGTTSPTSKLHVQGAVTGKALAIFNETGDQDIFTASASGTPKFVIDHSGNVGIGTTSPSQKLQVNGNIYSLYSNSKIIQESTTTNNNYSENILTAWGQGAQWSINAAYTDNGDPPSNMVYKVDPGTYNTGAGLLRFDANTKRWKFYSSPTSTGAGNTVAFTELASLATDSIHFSPSGSASTFYINSSGNVGIGTTSPSHKLDVSGDAHVSGAFYDSSDSAGSNSYILTSTGTGTTWTDTSTGAVSPWTYSAPYLYPDNATDRVGIGTTNTADMISQLYVTNGSTLGKALAIFNQTEDQDIITASASGTTKFRVDNSGYAHAQRFVDLASSDYYLDPAASTTSLTTAGSVGIGTTSPEAWLEINTPDATKNILLSRTGYTDEFQLRVSNNSIDDTLLITNSTNDTQGIIIQGNGDIGIGTTSPNNKLTILPSSGNGLTIRESDDGNNAITLSSNTTEGAIRILRNGSNVIQFHGGSGSDNYINNGGNLGIGTSTPTSKLHVQGAVTGKALAIFNETGDQDILVASKSGTTKFVVNKDGNVGIGTENPNERLEINGSIRGNQSGALRISTGNGYVDIGPKNSGWSHFQTDRSRYYFNTGVTIDTGNIGSYNEDLSLQTAGITQLTIQNSSGNVGIGTTSPGAKLDVNGQIIGGFGAQTTSGTLDWNDASNARSGNGYTLLEGDASNGPGPHTYFHPFSFEYYSKNGSGNLTQFAIPYGATSHMNSGLYMRGRYSGTWSNWMRIISENNDGNVGIGTTNPGSYKLYVNGTAYSTGGWQSSDIRWKKDIHQIQNALDIVEHLEPVRFSWRQDEYPDIQFPQGKQIGFIAQQVEPYLPEVVYTNNDGYKAIAYQNITALNTQAIKELSANLLLNNIGDLAITYNPNTYQYDVATVSNNSIFHQISAFAKSFIGELTAGLVKTQKLITQTTQTNLLTPTASNSAIIISRNTQNPTSTTYDLPSTNDPLLVVDGELSAATISARVAKLKELHTDKIVAKEIVADSIKSKDLESLKSTIHNLKTSTLSAQTIVNQYYYATSSATNLSDDELAQITQTIKNRLANLFSEPTAQDVPTASTSAETIDLALESTPSATTVDPNHLPDTIAIQPTLTADIATINNYLAVIGQAIITNLEITDHLYTSTIASKTDTLEIQPLGGTIKLAANTLIIDSTTGTVEINGDLKVNGTLYAQKAQINQLSIGSEPIYEEASSSGKSTLGNLLAVYNEQGEKVASIDASGSANFNDLTTQVITIATSSEASQSATPSGFLQNQVTSNATAGQATLVSPNTELTITSPYLDANSLVYLTPTSNTFGQVLYVKSKHTCPAQNQTPNTYDLSSNCHPSFTVAIDSPVSENITFNWWIIKLDHR